MRNLAKELAGEIRGRLSQAILAASRTPEERLGARRLRDLERAFPSQVPAIVYQETRNIGYRRPEIVVLKYDPRDQARSLLLQDISGRLRGALARGDAGDVHNLNIMLDVNSEISPARQEGQTVNV